MKLNLRKIERHYKTCGEGGVKGHLCLKCGLYWGDLWCFGGACYFWVGRRWICPECRPVDESREMRDRPGEWWYVHNGQKVDEFDAWVLKTRSEHAKTKRRS